MTLIREDIMALFVYRGGLYPEDESFDLYNAERPDGRRRLGLEVEEPQRHRLADCLGSP